MSHLSRPQAAELASKTLHASVVNDAAVRSAQRTAAAAACYPALQRAFAKCDAELIAARSQAGSTACVVFVRDATLFVANLGDSRAVLGSAGRRRRAATRLSTDHKPDLPSEKLRVEMAGGFVTFRGVWRVAREGCSTMLAVSRALGDSRLKLPTCVLSGSPEVSHRDLRANWDHFVIVASDGLWDVVSDEEAVALVYDQLGDTAPSSELYVQVATALVKLAVAKKSQDNVTAVILGLQW